MVAVFNKELLSWYLLTVKLNNTVYTGLRSTPTSPSTSQSPAPDQAPPPKPSLLRLPAPGGTRAGPSRPATPPPPPPEPEWVVTIREKLVQAAQDEAECPWAKLCIYRVPRPLREGDEKAYAPQLVSIGPFHRGKRRLREMDRHKWRSLHQVLRRTGHDLARYVAAVREVMEKARECYEGQVGVSGDEFIECLVVDGCFVLEIIRGASVEGFKELGYSRYDPVFAMRGNLHAIRQDMILLENQIPLFVLDRLLALQLGLPCDRRGLVATIAVRFFDPLMPCDDLFIPSQRRRRAVPSSHHSRRPAINESFDPLSEQGLHCLDVFRRSLLRSGPQAPMPRVWLKRRSSNHRVADRRRQQLIHCVSVLRKAGIKFERRNTDRFWDVRFTDGVLEMPRLFIHDGSKSLFLNLIAFEQCHMDAGNNVTTYVIFMDNLINSAEDVAYLHYRGILEHWLGEDDNVAELFNKLCQEVVFDINDSYLSGLSEQVNYYCEHRWNTWKASLKHSYFNNPWAIISLVAAVFLLLLTLCQTFYSVYAYHRPPG